MGTVQWRMKISLVLLCISILCLGLTKPTRETRTYLIKTADDDLTDEHSYRTSKSDYFSCLLSIICLQVQDRKRKEEERQQQLEKEKERQAQIEKERLEQLDNDIFQ